MSKVTACAATGVGDGWGRVAAGNGEAAPQPQQSLGREPAPREGFHSVPQAARPAREAGGTGTEREERGSKMGEHGGGELALSSAWAHVAFLPLLAPLPPAPLSLTTGLPSLLSASSLCTPDPPSPLHPPLCQFPPSHPLFLSPLCCRAQRFGTTSRWPQSASSTAAVTGQGAGAGAAEGQTRGVILFTVPCRGNPCTQTQS